jgi:polysaccharide pyruvyl transferase WcaK-like protein
MKWLSPRVIRGNRGDLLSRWGILTALAELGAGDVVVFCSRARHVPPLCRAGVEPYGPIYNLFPPLRSWRALRRTKVVVWTGGLDLQDDSSVLKLVHTFLVFSLYRLMGWRLLLAMQGAGPLTKPNGRRLALAILNRVHTFIVRDAGSQRLLEGLKSRAKIVRGYDGIFLPGFPGASPSPHERARIETLTRRDFDGQPLIGINVRLWFHFASSWVPYQFAKERYRRRAEAKMSVFLDAMAGTIRRLRAGARAKVLLISMYEPGVEPWEDDLPLLAQLKEMLATDAEVVLFDDDLGLPAFYTLIGQLDVMVGTRLHSTLTALRAGVPAIHLSYTLKGRDIFIDLGLSDWVMELEDFLANPGPLGDLTLRALTDATLRSRVRTLRDRVVAENLSVFRNAVANLEAAR